MRNSFCTLVRRRQNAICPSEGLIVGHCSRTYWDGKQLQTEKKTNKKYDEPLVKNKTTLGVKNMNLYILIIPTKTYIYIYTIIINYIIF